MVIFNSYVKLPEGNHQPAIIHIKSNSKAIQIITGWWLTYPSDKYNMSSSVGMIKFPIYYMEKRKFMFQTTNQIIYPNIVFDT